MDEIETQLPDSEIIERANGYIAEAKKLEQRRFEIASDRQEAIKQLGITKGSYKQFAKTPAGKDLLGMLLLLHERTLVKAESADNPEEAFGHLKTARAYGVLQAYIQRMLS